MKKKILLTGVTGFIGSYVKKRLEQEDVNIYCISRAKSGIYNECVADICQHDFIERVMECIPQCDVIIHLAASIDMNDGYTAIETNCIGTYNICRLANMWNSSKIIYMSSLPVIGVPQILPISEKHTIHPQTIYHITKYAGEQMVEACCGENIFKIIIRIPSPVGIGMNMKTFLPFVLNKCLLNEDITLNGNGRRRQNYVDVRDVAESVVKAVYYSGNGLFNIAGKKAVSNMELAEKCISITSAESNIVFSGINDKEEKYQWEVSIEKAERELGYMPKYSIEESIQWLYESIRI